jgi:hypothetical protein
MCFETMCLFELWGEVQENRDVAEKLRFEQDHENRS